MYGRHIGTLNVRVKRLVLGRPTYFLQWSRSGDHGNRWRVAQVEEIIVCIHVFKSYCMLTNGYFLKLSGQPLPT